MNKDQEQIVEIQKFSTELTRLQTMLHTKEQVLSSLSDITDQRCIVHKELGCKMTSADWLSIVNKLKCEVTDLTVDIGQVQQQLQSLTRANMMILNDVRTLTTLSKDLEDLNNFTVQLELLKNTSSQHDAVLNDLNELNKRLNNGQEILDKIRKAEYVNCTVADEKELIDKKHELSSHELLIKVFGAKGIITDILSQEVAEISKKINDRMMNLTSGKYGLKLDNSNSECKILISKEGLNIPYESLSQSELWRVHMVIQDAVSYLTKAKFIIIDNFEILDDNSKTFFFDTVNKMLPDYDQVIVIGCLKMSSVLEKFGILGTESFWDNVTISNEKVVTKPALNF